MAKTLVRKAQEIYFLCEVYSEGKQGLCLKKNQVSDDTSCAILSAMPFLK